MSIWGPKVLLFTSWTHMMRIRGCGVRQSHWVCRNLSWWHGEQPSHCWCDACKFKTLGWLYRATTPLCVSDPFLYCSVFKQGNTLISYFFLQFFLQCFAMVQSHAKSPLISYNANACFLCLSYSVRTPFLTPIFKSKGQALYKFE
jgi:hypothetical protein